MTLVIATGMVVVSKPRTVDELIAAGEFTPIVEMILSEQIPPARVAELVAQYPVLRERLQRKSPGALGTGAKE